MYISKYQYFSHMGQEYPFLCLSEFFSVSACLSQPKKKIAVSNCQSLLYIEPRELLVQAATAFISIL